MNKTNKTGFELLIFIIALVLISLISFVLASAPAWVGTNVNYSVTEDTVYYHNLSANITGYNSDISFAIDTESNITWTNASGTFNFTSSFFTWISILNSATGNLSINVTTDSQTGFFKIPIQATNSSGDSASTVENLEFIVNATNDAPVFTDIKNEYNLTQNILFLDYINASDEEEHYPLIVNITFNGSCNHASWTGRNPNENCSLYDFNFTVINFTDIDSLMNMTPTLNDVGVYWANISVIDFGNSSAYGCPHVYCDNETYNLNKTTYHSQIVKFNIFADLNINVSNCQNKILNESEEFTCQINITSKDETDVLNITSLAFLRNDASVGISNSSWFYLENYTTASNFQKSIYINVTPGKTEIGNWTINLTVQDISANQNSTVPIYIQVNRSSSLNNAPLLNTISDVSTSINLETIINFTVYDNDLLIPDKYVSLGGYNETSYFNVTIFNMSDTSQTLTISNFSVNILEMPVITGGLFTNRTEASIVFTVDTSDAGNYTINITVNDSQNYLDFKLFNLTILDNIAPTWDVDMMNNFTIWEDNLTFLNLSLNASDSDGDSLTFSFINNTAFPNFTIGSLTGEINLTPADEDVGQHIVNITVSDGYLTATKIFNFTIYNINDSIVIQNITNSLITNATGNSSVGINATEDNYTKITLWLHDDDLKIPSNQKGYYNEIFIVNLTIEGPNINLFNFTKTNAFPTTNFPNRTEYEAIFTPNKSDVGTYNITVNISDASNLSDVLVFNLTILNISHAPVLMNLTNQTSGINKTLWYDINATDAEDGADSEGNLTFNYSFLSGIDFILENQTIFNITSGILNMTFNDSQTGIYNLNITVNDTSGNENSQAFWIYVYGLPNITSPNSSEIFTLQENITSFLGFQANHSIGDNLTFNFYLNNILRYNLSYYGNETNLTWLFTPNFTDETYGQYENLTLTVLNPIYNEFNYTLNWSVNITHKNFNLTSLGIIPNQSGGSPINITLSNYFSDLDASDLKINQTINFTSNLISASGQTITVSVLNWKNGIDPLIGFSASAAGTSSYTLTVVEYNESDPSQSLKTLTSNEFIIDITSSTASASGSSSGGGTTYVPVSLKILMPDPVSAYQKDQIVLPISIYNDGSQTLNGITLSANISKDGLLRDDLSVSFDKDFLSILQKGQTEDVILTIDVNTQEKGTFEITVYADVKTPKFSDWGKLYLTIKEGTKVEEVILFTEEFIAQNPECIELKELVNEAWDAFASGNDELALEKAESAIDSCKNAISQPGKLRLKEVVENKLYRYLIIVTLFVFFMGIAYYSYKRIKLKRNLLKQNNLKNLKTIANI